MESASVILTGVVSFFFLQIVQILVYCFYMYISIGNSTVCLAFFRLTLKQTSTFHITGPLREEPVTTQRASNVDILVMCWHHHGWVDGKRDIGSFGTVDFSKCKPDCHMRAQYIWNNVQQSRVMAVLFDDLNRFLISVRDKLYETFTVYTVMAFTRWPRVAVKSTLLWLRTSFPCFPMIPSVTCEWRLPAAT